MSIPDPGRPRFGDQGMWAVILAVVVSVVIVASALYLFSPGPSGSPFNVLWSKSLPWNNQGVGVVDNGTFYTYYDFSTTYCSRP